MSNTYGASSTGLTSLFDSFVLSCMYFDQVNVTIFFNGFVFDLQLFEKTVVLFRCSRTPAARARGAFCRLGADSAPRRPRSRPLQRRKIDYTWQTLHAHHFFVSSFSWCVFEVCHFALTRVQGGAAGARRRWALNPADGARDTTGIVSRAFPSAGSGPAARAARPAATALLERGLLLYLESTSSAPRLLLQREPEGISNNYYFTSYNKICEINKPCLDCTHLNRSVFSVSCIQKVVKLQWP